MLRLDPDRFGFTQCHALLDRWRRSHREAHGSIGGVGTSRRAIGLAGSLPDTYLRGQVILVDGTLAGFAFGGEIRPGLACPFERKCDNAVKGLSHFQLHRLMLGFQDYESINDGSDAGRAGLRQLKESVRPITLNAEYRASQRPA